MAQHDEDVCKIEVLQQGLDQAVQASANNDEVGIVWQPQRCEKLQMAPWLISIPTHGLF